MTKRKERRGRRKGSRNTGYFYRAGRGWVTKEGPKFIPLTTESGERLRDPNTPEVVVKEAYARYTIGRKNKPAVGNGVTVDEVCAYYLDHAKRENRASTFKMRADTLFDLCYGFPPKFRESKEKPTKADRIHDGYGTMRVTDLRRFHLEAWLNAHPGWADRRTRLQAIRRALTLAVDDGLIPGHQIGKFRIPQGRARVTYITPEQERFLLAAARPALKIALRVLIRTGMRPCEFAAITASHINDQGHRMEIRFTAEETKSFKQKGEVRTVKIADPEIMELIRSQAKLNGPGPRQSHQNAAVFPGKTGDQAGLRYVY